MKSRDGTTRWILKSEKSVEKVATRLCNGVKETGRKTKRKRWSGCDRRNVADGRTGKKESRRERKREQ